MEQKPTQSKSHGLGLVWEQQIRTARSILNAFLKRHRRSLNDEPLHTLLIEVEAIVSSWLITTETINGIESHAPLSPSSY